MRLAMIAAASVFAATACSKETEAAAPASEDAPARPAALPPVHGDAEIDPLADTIWTLTPTDGRAGTIRIFTSDGTMLQGSCGEPYRLSAWRRVDDGSIAWNEDGVDITAAIVSVDEVALTMALNLGAKKKTETYRVAAAPFVCPDLPR